MNSNFEYDNDDFDLEAALAASQFDEDDDFEEFDDDHEFDAALQESIQAQALNDLEQGNTSPNNRQTQGAQLMRGSTAQSHAPA